MNFNMIGKSFTRMIGKTRYFAKAHTPEILMGVGIVGTVGSTVLACIATTKVEPAVDTFTETLDKIHENAEKSESMDNNDEWYPIKDQKRDVSLAYGMLIKDVVKLYAPAVLLGTFSIACICKSNYILKKRNLALAGAYAALETKFGNYRKNVVERFGEDLDHELLYGIKNKEITVTDGDETKTDIVAVATTVPDDCRTILLGPDDCRGVYDRNPIYTLDNLRIIQRTANDNLEAWGIVTVNDILKMIGRKPNAAWADFGWVYDKNITNKIDFGLYELHREKTIDFQNGLEDFLLIELNIDGHIPTVIKEMKEKAKTK